MNSYVNNLRSAKEECNKLFGKSVLIIVPHSDDEVIISGNLIAFRMIADLSTAVCVVTNGDYLAETKNKGINRISESIRACKLLGLPEKDFYYLGYSDTGSLEEESFLARLLHSKGEEIIEGTLGCLPYGLDSFPPFHGTQKFSLNNLKVALTELIIKTECTSIVTTSIEDTHGDHSALVRILKEVVITLDNPPKIYCGLVHSKDGDENWPNRDKDVFFKPKTLASQQWENRVQTNYAQFLDKDIKKDALAQYITAFQDEEQWIIDYLKSFAKEEEVFLKVE